MQLKIIATKNNPIKKPSPILTTMADFSVTIRNSSLGILNDNLDRDTIQAKKIAIWLKNGNMYLKVGAFDKAIDQYQKVLSIDHTNNEANFNSGVAYFQLRKYTEAKHYFMASCDQHDKTKNVAIELYLTYISFLIQDGYDASKLCLLIERSKTSKYENDQAYPEILQKVLAKPRLFSEREKQVLGFMDLIIDHAFTYCLKEGTPLSWVGDTYRSMFIENYQLAALAYEKIPQKDPKNTELWWGLGTCYYTLGDLNKAYHYYHKVLKLDPGSEHTQDYLRLIQEQLLSQAVQENNFRQAKGHYKLLKKLQPQTPPFADMLRMLGSRLAEERPQTLENYHTALTIFTKAHELDQNDPATLNLIADTYCSIAGMRTMLLQEKEMAFTPQEYIELMSQARYFYASALQSDNFRSSPAGQESVRKLQAIYEDLKQVSR